MINIDTRILPQVTPDQLYLLCHIVNFMNENKMCFPSNKKLIEQSGFSESKILRVKNDLVTRNIISVKKRFRGKNSNMLVEFSFGKANVLARQLRRIDKLILKNN